MSSFKAAEKPDYARQSDNIALPTQADKTLEELRNHPAQAEREGQPWNSPDMKATFKVSVGDVSKELTIEHVSARDLDSVIDILKKKIK